MSRRELLDDHARLFAQLPRTTHAPSADPGADTCVHFDLRGGNVLVSDCEPVVIATA